MAQLALGPCALHGGEGRNPPRSGTQDEEQNDQNKQHKYHLTKNRVRFQKIKTIELGTKRRKKVNRFRAGIEPRRRLETWGIYTRAGHQENVSSYSEQRAKRTCNGDASSRHHGLGSVAVAPF